MNRPADTPQRQHGSLESRGILKFDGRRLLIAVVAALIVAGSALAYITATGTGSGTAVAGTVSDVTFSPAAPVTNLYPGASADVALTVANPNDIAVRIPSIALDPTNGTVGFSVDGAHPGCDVSALSFTTDSTGWTIPANASAYPIDLTGAISMSTSAASECQNATFTVYLKVGP